ncbi:PDDEXK family nuclease [Ralstonia chuxiongensis]|uniref:hypothetical protein n=1 Tax=Ralstonia chuxiongensis TaxID=2957504 RepID=UPI002930B2AC|nr:hypothetical protein [Ralstonia chuxiongensis]
MVMTIDFMLALRIPGYPSVIYHGVSAKPSALVAEEKVVRRHNREAGALWTWAATHEVMTELTVSQQECANYRRLHAFMLHTDRIENYARDAQMLALALSGTTARGTLDRVLGMVGKRLGYDRRTAYRLFGVANFLGHLSWDHRFSVSPREPMMLMRSQRVPITVEDGRGR